ncbi:phosphate acyltransferase [Synergistes jonesii]|uniref:phosphate acyltransferase n=1 Tax=Synergistes jonesii TaxID=2754 RepID=UPI00248E3F18|nr:phosphate acyltransferase [Synergistes jonesii]
MYKSFDEIINDGGSLAGSSVVAAAADRETLAALKMAFERGLGHALLTGREKIIAPIAKEFGVADKCEILDAESEAEAVKRAVAAARDGCADVLMNGAADAPVLMRAALDRECGLRCGRTVSYLAVMEIPHEEHLSFCSDGAFIVAPTLDQKKHILRNALKAIHALGYEHVNVACIAAGERADRKIPSAADAAALVAAWRAGEFDDLPCTCTIEGPMSVDVAASSKAAERRGIKSVIAGKADLLLAPNIECGSALCRTLVCYCGAKFAGVALGARVPIALSMPSDDAETRFRGAAIACAAAAGR